MDSELRKLELAAALDPNLENLAKLGAAHLRITDLIHKPSPVAPAGFSWPATLASRCGFCAPPTVKRCGVENKFGSIRSLEFYGKPLVFFCTRLAGHKDDHIHCVRGVDNNEPHYCLCKWS